MLADVLSMASIKRRRGAKVWTAYYRDSKGIQYCRSTYLSDKKDAQRVADAYEEVSREQQSLRQISKVLAKCGSWREPELHRSRCGRTRSPG